MNCDLTKEYCQVNAFLGIFSIICFLVTAIAICVFRDSIKIVVLFFTYFVCIIMMLYYFLVEVIGNELYFVKEYLILLCYYYTVSFIVLEAYQLLKKSTFLSRLALVNVISAIAVFAFIIIYLGIAIFEDGESAFNCNSYIWILMHGLGSILSIEFVALGIIITKKLQEIKSQLNIDEARRRITYLWLFISLVFVSSALKTTQSLLHFYFQEKKCFNVIRNSGSYNAVVYVIIIIFSDYPLIFCVLLLFLQRGKPMKSDIALVTEDPENLSLSDKDSPTRVHKDSIDFVTDYILYQS